MTPPSLPNADPPERALIDGLREHGYVVGQNLVIEFRSAYGKRAPLPELAVELVRDRIFKCSKPADLPIEEPTTFDLVSSLTTAKALAVQWARSPVAQPVEQVAVGAAASRPKGGMEKRANSGNPTSSAGRRQTRQP